MREIYIDVANGSDNTIKVTQGDNLTETYKLILMRNKIRINLTDRKVKFAFLKENSNHGDIIENLDITNAIEGEIDFPITNRITKIDGLYSCGIAIYNSTGYLEYTGTFSLYVRENIFEKVSGELLENSTYKELISLLDKATGLNKELDPLVTNGTILKTSLENDIIQASNLKNDLETNTNRATTINDTLVKNTATAVEKNTTLNNSLSEAKKYINGLDGSQNIPQIRMDITELQNGLKNNQMLDYEGTNLTCENTLDGRIENIVLEGRTYQNLFDTKNIIGDWKFPCKISANGNSYHKQYLAPLTKPNTEYTIIVKVSDNTINHQFTLTGWNSTANPAVITKNDGVGIFKRKITTRTDSFSTSWDMELWRENIEGFITIDWLVILEGDWTNKEIPSYFEGIKSVGEKEGKISILSRNANLFVIDSSKIKNLNREGDITITDEEIYCNIGNSWNAGFTYETDALKPNTSYTLTRLVSDKFNANNFFRVEYYYKGILVDNIENTGVSGVATVFTTSTKRFDKAVLNFKNNGLNVTEGIYKPMLVETQHADINYCKAKKDKREFILEDGLKGLPNDVCDTIENREDGTYLVERVKKIVFDGSDDENFNICANTSDIFVVQIDSNAKNDSLTYISNYNVKHEFRWDIKEWETRDYVGVNFSNTPGKLTILFPKEKYTTLTDISSFKAWLQNNPFELYYELAEPVLTKISDTKLSLDTYNAITYVFSNNAISPNIKLKIASNLGSIIQQNARSINDIYKLIDEILIPQITTNTADIATLKLK